MNTSNLVDCDRDGTTVHARTPRGSSGEHRKLKLRLSRLELVAKRQHPGRRICPIHLRSNSRNTHLHVRHLILIFAYKILLLQGEQAKLIFDNNSLCILDHRFTKSLRADQNQNPHAVYEAAVEREFSDWRSEWESRFPDLFIGHTICTICFDPIGDREIIRGLPCLHVFHKNCMDAWFEALHVTCPLCKQDILKLPSPCYRPASEQV